MTGPGLVLTMCQRVATWPRAEAVRPGFEADGQAYALDACDYLPSGSARAEQGETVRGCTFDWGMVHGREWAL